MQTGMHAHTQSLATTVAHLLICKSPGGVGAMTRWCGLNPEKCGDEEIGMAVVMVLQGREAREVSPPGGLCSIIGSWMLYPGGEVREGESME